MVSLDVESLHLSGYHLSILEKCHKMHTSPLPMDALSILDVSPLIQPMTQAKLLDLFQVYSEGTNRDRVFVIGGPCVPYFTLEASRCSPILAKKL